MHLLNLSKSALKYIPGLFLIFYSLGIPSEINRTLVKGIIEVFCTITLIVFFYRKKKNEQVSWTIKRKYGFLFLILFFLTLMGYIIILENFDIYSSKYDASILLPFSGGDELKYMLVKSGSASKAILLYGPEAVREAINESKSSIAITKIIFICIYTLIFEFLTLSFSYFTYDYQLFKS